jgi:hypothetical protein
MKQPVTVLASFKLAEGKTESDLLAASDHFQEAFVSKHAGILRRELIKTGDREYTDIVQFSSRKDAEKVMVAEAQSEDCHAFFSVMDMSEMDENVEFHLSLATYNQSN